MTSVSDYRNMKPAGTRIVYLLSIPGCKGKIEMYVDRMDGSQVVTFSTGSHESQSLATEQILRIRETALTCHRVLDHTKEWADGVAIEGGVGWNQVFLNNLSFIIGFGWALFVALHSAERQPIVLHVESLGPDGKPLAETMNGCLYPLKG
jgi:hypothetical protein